MGDARLSSSQLAAMLRHLEEVAANADSLRRALLTAMAERRRVP